MIQVLLAFLGSVALTILLRQPAHRAGLVDRPSGRKMHHAVVPVIGGIAMMFAFMAFAAIFGQNYRGLAPLLLGTLLLTITGALDDRHDLSARTKLIAQIVAVVFMTSWADQVIYSLGDIGGTGPVKLGAWALPFTAFTMVGVVNAMNMIDGMDGLAGSVAVTAMIWLAGAAALCAASPQMDLLFLLMGAVGGFLLFNLRYPVKGRAQVFMGDAGSMALGLVLGWFAVDLTQHGGTAGKLYPISAVWILGVPILDTTYLMVRRMLRGQSPFAPDRRHIHHTLVIMGLSEGWALFVILALSCMLGAIGLFGWRSGVPESVLSYGFVATFAAYCIIMQYWRRMFALARKLRRSVHHNRVSAQQKW
ncbi:MAG TPA: MraY family glycosyltransferase [Burkholderiales bacterium]|nr:MraY family glycosyltransferase [Burkholderiales bacterium]